MTQEQPQIPHVEVDKDQIREEIGRVPGVQADRYPRDTHITNADRMYNVPLHDVAGAIAMAEARDRHLLQRAHYTIDEVAGWVKEYLKQEDQSHKAALEARQG